jgi:frataxin-like iron-binding protein CyaY
MGIGYAVGSGMLRQTMKRRDESRAADYEELLRTRQMEDWKEQSDYADIKAIAKEDRVVSREAAERERTFAELSPLVGADYARLVANKAMKDVSAVNASITNGDKFVDGKLVTGHTVRMQTRDKELKSRFSVYEDFTGSPADATLNEWLKFNPTKSASEFLDSHELRMGQNQKLMFQSHASIELQIERLKAGALKSGKAGEFRLKVEKLVEAEGGEMLFNMLPADVRSNVTVGVNEAGKFVLNSKDPNIQAWVSAIEGKVANRYLSGAEDSTGQQIPFMRLITQEADKLPFNRFTATRGLANAEDEVKGRAYRDASSGLKGLIQTATQQNQRKFTPKERLKAKSYLELMIAAGMSPEDRQAFNVVLEKF